MSLSNETKHSRSALAPTRNRQHSNNCAKNVKWLKEEDELLSKLMLNEERPNYAQLAERFPGKTGQQVAERWDKVINPKLVKGSWTREEDEIIVNYVREHGAKNWRNLGIILPGRIGKQCRERWRNHLDPSINHSPWTQDEDSRLLELHQQFGNHWVQISKLMSNRSENSIKNRWNSVLKKQVSARSTCCHDLAKPEGIDDDSPVNESPISTPMIVNASNMNFGSPFGLGKIQIPSPFAAGKNPIRLSLEENRIALNRMFPKNN